MPRHEVILLNEVERWLFDLYKTDPTTAAQITAAIRMLEDVGPTLGAPLVKRITSSRHHHMKELRPGSAGSSEIRILFAFDPKRQAVLLIAGDKSGDWDGWYRKNIKTADRRYDDHLQGLDNT